MSNKEKKMTETKDNTELKEKGETNANKANVSPSSSKAVVVKEEKNIPQELTSEELQTLDYTDFSTPARMLELGKVLAKSSLVPLNKADDVAVALMTGKELGLPFITSVSQIYPINGRPTLGVHIQRALLIGKGIIFQKVEDAVDIYEFYKANEQGTTALKTVGNKQVPVAVLGKGTLEEQPKNSTKRKVDVRTTYKFTREIKQPSGKYKEITCTSSFSLEDARLAELTDNNVWVKYWKRMLDARAFTIGAKEIASDVILGIHLPSELSNDFYINDKGEEVHTATIIEDN